MKKLPVLFALVLSLYSCASYHGQQIATSTSELKLEDNIVVSAEKIDELSDKSHTMIVLTFENKGEDWTRYKGSSFSCGDECDSKTNIIMGLDLNTWMKSQYHKRTISQHNDALLYGGLMILGLSAAIMGAKSGSNSLGVAGLSTYALGTGSLVHMDIKNSQLATKTGEIDPQSDHLYNPFAVPASGFSKKWILLHTPRNQQIKNINLKLENEGGEIETYTAKL